MDAAGDGGLRPRLATGKFAGVRLASLMAITVLNGLIAGCASTARPVRSDSAAPAPTPTPSAVETREINLADGWITVRMSIPARPPGPKPAVISPFDDDAALLERGIVPVRFHTNWERLRGLTPQPEPAPEAKVGAWLLAAPRPGIVGKAYFGLITEDAFHTLPKVLDHLETVPEIDPARIAIGGSSTGGFVALQALIADPRLCAAVVRVACGDYHAFLKASSLALNNDPRWLPGGTLVLDDDYEATLREIEPIRHAGRFPPRPLLLINGADDPAIPAACARRTARVLARAYDAAGVPERFRFELYADRGHDVGARAEIDALAWWDRWLLVKRTGRVRRIR